MSNTIYSRDFLLDRLYDNINKSKSNSKILLAKPQVSSANRRTYFANFKQFCTAVKRDQLHVKQYFDDELRKMSSISNNGCLVIQGMFQQKHIDKLLKKYIEEYVKCKICKKGNTELIKENRIQYIKCNVCLSKTAIE